MTDSLGAAKLSLMVDMSDWDVAIARSKDSLANLASGGQEAFNNTTYAAKRGASALADYVAALGKTADQTRLLRALKNGVDPAVVQAAERAMLDYAEAAAYAEDQQRQLSASIARMKLGEGILNDLREQITTFGMSKEALTLYKAGLAGVQAEALPLVQTLDRLNREQEISALRAQAAADAFQRQVAAASGYAASQQAAEQATRRRADAEAAFLPLLEREAQLNQAATTRGEFLRQLDREAKTIGKTRSELMEMRAAELGLTQAAAPLIAKLREQEQALLGNRRAADDGKKALNAYGLSQKQFEFAMRGVPAQITDIAVSLQGGQNPLTVLLQQGGQLKDMFGGIKPAAAALGGELLKLVNVYTLSASAVVGLVVAFQQAEKQQYAFTVALASTGNNAKLTVGQLSEMADQINRIDGVGINDARQALVGVVSSGRIAAESIQEVADIAARLKYSTGQSIDDTIRKFEEISRNPVEALRKLTETEHFLTATQDARIKTMVEQGNKTEAVAEATKLYREYLLDVDKAAASALPATARMWADIKDNTTGAWSELVEYIGLFEKFTAKFGVNGGKGLSVGDVLTSQFKIAGDFAGLANNFARDYWDLGGTTPTFATQGVLFDKDKEERDRKMADAQKAWQAEIAKTDRATAWQLRVGEIAGKASAAGIGFGSAEYQKVLADEEKKFNESWDRRGKVAQQSYAAQNNYALQAIRDQLALDQGAIQASQQLLQSSYSNKQIFAEEYYARQRELIQQSADVEVNSLEKQISYLRAAAGNKNESINNLKQIGELETRIQQIRSKNTVSLRVLSDEESAYMLRRRQMIEDYAEALQDNVVSIQRDYAARAQAIGLGSREAEIQSALNAIYYEQAAALRELTKERDRGGITPAEFEQKSALLRQSGADQAAAIRDGYDLLAKAEGDWRNGFISVAADYQQKMGDIAGNTRSVIEGTFDGLNAAIEEAVLTGKANLDDLGRYLTKMAVQFGTTKLFSYLMSMWGGGGVGQVQRESIPLTFNAKGNVYDSPSLSAYSNGVYNSPQPFMFAKGAGIFGEAGPEAIMPLARTSNGDLGVQMAGGASSSPQITVNVYGVEGEPQVNVRETGPGAFDIDVIAAKFEQKTAAGIMNGTSVLGRALTKRYHLQER